MRSTMLGIIGAGLLVAGPALAQSNSSQIQPANSSTNQQTQNSGETPQALQKSMKHDLASEGFTNIQIMPESFLIRAHDKQGRPVMMVVNPDSVLAVTKVASGNGGTSGGNAGTPLQNPNSNGSGSGSSGNSSSGNSGMASK